MAAPLTHALRFEDFGLAVEFVDCRDMAEAFLSIVRGWSVTEVTGAVAPLSISFRRQGGRYAWISNSVPAPHRWKEHPPRTPAQAACDFHYHFLNIFARQNPKLFCLHSAAADFTEGLVVFPGVQRAGKSTLSVQLARSGPRVFCDDVLPLEGGTHEGLAMGILPRLRLPMPGTASSDFHAFVSERAGLSSDRWHYVSLREREIASFGEKRAVCGVVRLARVQTYRPAALAPLSEGGALKALIEQNFGDATAPLTIFEDLRDLVCKARCFELTYGDLDEASRLLVAEFGGAGGQQATPEA
jgi:hypothetical protein